MLKCVLIGQIDSVYDDNKCKSLLRGYINRVY